VVTATGSVKLASELVGAVSEQVVADRQLKPGG
jgi:hypothetical protein